MCLLWFDEQYEWHSPTKNKQQERETGSEPWGRKTSQIKNQVLVIMPSGNCTNWSFYLVHVWNVIKMNVKWTIFMLEIIYEFILRKQNLFCYVHVLKVPKSLFSLMDKKYLNKALSAVGQQSFQTTAYTLQTAPNESATQDIKTPNQCHFYIKSKRLCFPS